MSTLTSIKYGNDHYIIDFVLHKTITTSENADISVISDGSFLLKYVAMESSVNQFPNYPISGNMYIYIVWWIVVASVRKVILLKVSYYHKI